MERGRGRQHSLFLGDVAATAVRESPPGEVIAVGGTSAASLGAGASVAAELAAGGRHGTEVIEYLYAQAVRDLGDVRFSRAYRLIKRALDAAVAGVGLLLLSPLLLLVALLIRLDSPGPSLFVQDRVGQHGRLFPMVKFRTMVHGSAVRLVGPHKRPDDDRVTRVGRVLRRTSLDELPQLLNVLAGQMSLVGPRPELPAIVLAHYAPWQYRRLLVPQGMTGWWQVTGRGAKLLYQHTADDIYYLAHAGLGFDLRILAWTARAVFRRDGAF
ncbi:MAG TPA: sugar transferase [Thermomicrobiaceae bacterium]|nr:sugar transferase [Thermomicrobiaceae bacterium]